VAWKPRSGKLRTLAAVLPLAAILGCTFPSFAETAIRTEAKAETVQGPDSKTELTAPGIKFRLWGRGPEVEKLRDLLVRQGVLDPGKVHGERYDRDVMAAVRAFQKRVGLRTTGIPRMTTLKALVSQAPPTPPKAAESASAPATPPVTPKAEAPTVRQATPQAAPAPAEKATQPTAPNVAPTVAGRTAPPTTQVPATPAPAGAPSPAPPSTPVSGAPRIPIPATRPDLTSVQTGVLIAPPKPAALTDMPMFTPQTADRLGEAAKLYRMIVAGGGWAALPARTQFEIGKPNDLAEPLRRRLAAEGYLSKDAAQGAVFDRALSDALHSFQRRHGLPETDAIRKRVFDALNVPAETRLTQIESSRARVMKPPFANFEMKKGPYVVLNIPALTVELVDNGKVVASHIAIAGKPTTPSPQLVTRITGVSPNPSWTVPYSIAQREFAPKVRKKPHYLEWQEMRVERNGVPVNATTVDWSVRNYELRQKPGPRNSLGQLRIDMRNPHSVYFHDTPARKLFDHLNRYRSHGCARVRDVFGLAAAILRYTDPALSRDAVMAKIQAHDGGWEPGRKIELRAPIPVAWVYLTAWVADDGKVEFRNDVYKRDAAVVAPRKD
jgi:murein L,D-transpeptidase YcbB/YkuD